MASTYTTRGQIAHHPFSIAITLLLVGEHRLVGITEGEIESLGREVSNDVGCVTSPQRDPTFVLDCATEALADTIVLALKTTSLQHLILLYDEDQHMLYVLQTIQVDPDRL